jgi:hypothetical protein
MNDAASRVAIAKKKTEQKTFAILGMHRSGTSCLAGVLEEWGVTLGEVSKKNPHNIRGNQENQEIVSLHDLLLEANGGSWDRPPERVVWSDDHRQARDAIIERYRLHSCWGFKDPRTLLALEGWLEAIPDLRMVGTFRHPLAVAASLGRRNQFPAGRSIGLWKIYNQKLLMVQSQFDFPIISFDEPPEEYRSSLVRLRELMGLGGDPEIGFFEAELRNQFASSKTDPLSEEVAALYEDLQKVALQTSLGRGEKLD